ncbi:MAG: Glutathione peroxidase family protein [uncultured Sulfurovum sp.]|uniref:Glutathione peroxidase n=1 Tax=uncultured Sulfurovum sp. TaxID=269237 RepID=A0A6S6SMR9_9BACT|nr:MAG: Glutathione peroxidase family protein [uncultured Sulfurovum sp.]
MKNILLSILLLIPISIQAGEPMSEKKTTTFYDYNATSIIGENISMSKYQNKVVLIVNVASECGFTSQYKGLQELYNKHQENGLVILAFPSNQFGKQESGTHEEIQKFCSNNYHITFPMFEKIDVNGDNAHPLYLFLKSKATGLMWTEGIKWNFTKFLINKKGEVLTRYGSSTKPKDIEKDILKLLEEK